MFSLQPHRPRNEGGGGRHKKRVRQPHNTRERQRQLAVGHGEYIMPQNIHYRTPQVWFKYIKKRCYLSLGLEHLVIVLIFFTPVLILACAAPR